MPETERANTSWRIAVRPASIVSGLVTGAGTEGPLLSGEVRIAEIPPQRSGVSGG
jgi:hypothetical protein